MKNLVKILISVIVASSVFYSCNKKDDDDVAPSPAVYGDFYINAFVEGKLIHMKEGVSNYINRPHGSVLTDKYGDGCFFEVTNDYTKPYFAFVFVNALNDTSQTTRINAIDTGSYDFSYKLPNGAITEGILMYFTDDSGMTWQSYHYFGGQSQPKISSFTVTHYSDNNDGKSLKKFEAIFNCTFYSGNPFTQDSLIITNAQMKGRIIPVQ